MNKTSTKINFRLSKCKKKDKSVLQCRPWPLPYAFWNSPLFCVPSFSPDTGHYTALLWAGTHRVGCGFVAFLGPDQDGWYTKHFVCNYGPAGNKFGAALYQVGAAGTECEQQDTAYHTLCA
jgi:hypothetical protein